MVFSRPNYEVKSVFSALGQNKNWGIDMFLVPELWKYSKGAGVKVAILDTGAGDPPHVDLAGAYVACKNFTSDKPEAFADRDGHGCISPNDMIWTSTDGLISIKDFYEKDFWVVPLSTEGYITKSIESYDIKTLSRQGEYRKIQAIHKLKYEGPVIKVKTTECELTLTPWHPLYTVSSRRGLQETLKKKRADELCVSDKIETARLPIRTSCLTEFRLQGKTIQLDEDLAFWLGLVLTDGHVSKKQYKRSSFIRFDNKNLELLKHFNHLTYKIFSKTLKIKNGKYGVYYSVLSSNEIHELVTNIFNFEGGKKSLEIGVPTCIATAPIDIFLSFLAGVIEGDGSINNTIRVRSGSKKFVYYLRDLLRFYGIRASVSKKWEEDRLLHGRVAKFGNKFSYLLKISPCRDLLNKLKFKKFNKIIKISPRKREKIISVSTENYSGYLYDLTVEGSHNYVANTLVVSNTLVAGIIGARDNAFGVVGIAPECSLYGAKVLNDDGTGNERFVIDAIEWAIEMKVDIINMSFGTRKQPTRALQDVIRKAYANNITLLGAAGNVGEQGKLDTIDWPAKYPEVISVGAISRDQLRAKFSSVGTRIDLLAPGEDILSTYLNNDYVTMSGTSFACPFAVGVAALCIARHRIFPGKTPCVTPTQVREHLLKSAIDVGAPGWDREGGFGIIHPISLLDEDSLEKSEVVGDFRVSNRQIPELTYINARKKIPPLRVVQINTNFIVETFGGEQNGKPGDFLVVDTNGGMWIIEKDDFLNNYEII